MITSTSSPRLIALLRCSLHFTCRPLYQNFTSLIAALPLCDFWAGRSSSWLRSKLKIHVELTCSAKATYLLHPRSILSLSSASRTGIRIPAPLRCTQTVHLQRAQPAAPVQSKRQERRSAVWDRIDYWALER